ncbi:MAG TPA: gamma-glutamylcyclotransferase family protein [Jiangellaceae bacterium]|nr:gamma-glutamylcyclotransferase family protein [Jiangellaceae bacterium]
MVVLYFAYGSNMSRETMTRLAPSAMRIGKARLPNHRLRFSRKSLRTGTGVADVVHHPGFVVMGALYEIPEHEWNTLRQKEGATMAPPAYREAKVEVFSFGDKSNRKAVTFVVAEPEQVEQVPSVSYISDMVQQATELGFPAYAAFLEWLQRRAMEGSLPLRDGLLVSATKNRGKSHGRYIVRANPRLFGDSRGARLVSVEFDGRTTVAAFAAAAEVQEGSCEIDQNLRHALGMIGQNCYGYTVTLRPEVGGRVRPTLVKPRNLCLKVRQTNWTDSEKRVCILHPKNIVMLGIKEGEQVEIESSTRGDDGRLFIKKIRLRAYTSEQRSRQSRGYPEVDHVYLDQECREELGLSGERNQYSDWPVLVRPSVRHQLRRRVAVYGVTFFLGIASLSQVFALMAPSFPEWVRVLAAVLTAVIATIIVAWVDIRANISY